MNILASISLIEPWMFIVFALSLLAISAMINELTIIPWVCLAITCVGIVDYYNFSIINQIIVFSVTLSVSVYLTRRISSKVPSKTLISESINDLISRSVKVCEVNQDNSCYGKALSSSGKKWNVEYKKNKPLTLHKKYRCLQVTGITIIIDD